MTRIGLLSDSHGRSAGTQRAARLLIERGADLLVHLGDVGGEPVIDALVEGLDGDGKLSPGVHLVFGNTDERIETLAEYARDLGVTVNHPLGRVEADGRTVLFTHGDVRRLMDQALSQQPDYLLHGHTHRQRDERIGATRIINPGALHRAPEYSAALLDLTADELTFVPVPK